MTGAIPIEFVNEFKSVQQFEWGDFFLFGSVPHDFEVNFEKLDLPESISLTETTIQAVLTILICIFILIKKS